jgi:hypothetical protein
MKVADEDRGDTADLPSGSCEHNNVCQHLLTLVPRSRISFLFYPENGGDTFIRNVG